MLNREERCLPRTAFASAISFSQLFGIGVMIMCGIWLGKYQGGYDWDGTERQFNYHPLFMIVGMVFLNAEGLLVERVLRYESNTIVRFIHFFIHLAAFIFAVIALLAVFSYHNNTHKPNMFSLHSWVGIVLVTLFALQLLVGFFVFVLPWCSDSAKESFMPFYKFFGVSFFVGSIAQCLIGITQENIYKIKNYSEMGTEAMIANFLGLVLIVFCFTVLAAVIPEQFRRPTEKERAIMMLERYDSD